MVAHPLLDNELLDLKSQLKIHELKLEKLAQEIASVKNEQAQSRVFELEKSLNLINNLFQCASDAIAALDNELYIKVMNESFNELFSRIIANKVYVGMSLIRALADYPKLKSQIINACQKALLGEKTSVLVEANHYEEQYYCYELCINSLYNHYYQKSELVLRIRNLSEYKLQERRERKQLADIAQSSKDSAMGHIAVALAHEVNQPLTAIIAYSRSCLFLMNNNAHLQEIGSNLLAPLEQIAVQAEHAGEVINNMKNFMHEDNLYVEETNINLVIQDALSILNYELLDFKLTITMNLSDDLPLIMTNKTHLMQVILNLARNSIEACKGAATTNPELLFETQRNDGLITVQVKDNGPGIPAEYHNKILNTYFTTKSQGTGIGLGICRSFVEGYGGELSLQSNRNEGACFTFTIPINLENKHEK